MWRTTSHPTKALSKLPGSSRSALNSLSRLSAPGSARRADTAGCSGDTSLRVHKEGHTRGLQVGLCEAWNTQGASEASPTALWRARCGQQPAGAPQWVQPRSQSRLRGQRAARELLQGPPCPQHVVAVRTCDGHRLGALLLARLQRRALEARGSHRGCLGVPWSVCQAATDGVAQSSHTLRNLSRRDVSYCVPGSQLGGNEVSGPHPWKAMPMRAHGPKPFCRFTQTNPMRGGTMQLGHAD